VRRAAGSLRMIGSMQLPDPSPLVTRFAALCLR